MKFERTIKRIVFAAAWTILAPCLAAHADSVEDFYKDKTVTVYVGVSPGGIYSSFAQILVRHMEKHMPGHPNFIVQHMEGAGGARAVDYVYNVAAKDGTVFMTPNPGVALRVLLKIGNTKYAPEKLNWLGGWGDAVNTLTLLEPAPVKTVDEAKKKEVVLGAIGKNGNSYWIPALMNSQLGTKFKIISGYQGGTPIRLAIEKHEVDGWCGQWEGWKLAKPELLRDGKLVHLVQLAARRSKDLPTVPLLSELATTDEQRAIFKIVQTGIADRAFVAPPDVPKDRLTAAAKAYQATLRDPAFLADAHKAQFEVDPVDGKEIQEFIRETMATTPERAEKMRKAMGLEGQS
jgi:tripartite-type tricarboxylate transporter receptor subunit TctC